MYMGHNIQVKELIRSVAEWRKWLAYKKYTLGLPGTINELGVPGTVQVDFEKQGSCHDMIMSCRGMSDIKGISQKPESSMPRHAHSMPWHEFGSMPRHD